MRVKMIGVHAGSAIRRLSPRWHSPGSAAGTAPAPAEPRDRLYHVAIALLVIAGILLRSRGVLFGSEGLWLDECDWAIKLIERPLERLLIRPIGFMAVSKMVVGFFGPTTFALRAIPFAAGIATTLLAPLFARELLRTRAARLVLVGVIALHPGAIDLAKEFKPYSVGLLLHMAVATLALRYARTRRIVPLAVLLVVSLIGVLFAQDMVFAYPGIFLLAGWSAFRSRRRGHLVAVGGGALLTLACVGTLFLLMWRHMNPERQTDYWGGKYDVFYTGPWNHGGASQLQWVSEKVADLAAFPGQRRDIWGEGLTSPSTLDTLRRGDRLLWATLSLIGAIVLAAGRRGREALVVVLPLFIMVTFNLAGRWPLGVFRTNLFALTYVAALSALAFDARWWSGRRWWLTALPVAALVILPMVLFEETWHSRKRVFAPGADFPGALRALIEMQGPVPQAGPELLALDVHSSAPWNFYTMYDPEGKASLAPELARRFEWKYLKTIPAMLAGVEDHLRANPGERAWLLFTKGELRSTIDLKWPGDLDIVERRNVRDRHLVFGARLKP